MKSCIVLISAVLILGCNPKKQDEIQSEINVFIEVKIPDNLQVRKQLRLSAFVDTLIYIPLQTTTECLISSINDIKQSGERLFIRTDKREIFVFSKNGEFLNRIGTRGKGPNEYYSVIDFAVTDSSVYILDYSSRIARFTHSGEFEKYLRLPKQASRILSLENKSIACYIPDSEFKSEEKFYSWLIINQYGDSIGSVATPKLRELFGKDHYVTNHFVLTNISTFSPFTFKEPFNDSLYVIDPYALEIEAFASIDQGIHNMDFEATFEQVMFAKHNMRINNILDTPKYIFINYKCMCYGNNQIHYAVFDKVEKSFFNLNDQNDEEKIENDIDEGVNFRFLTCLGSSQLVGFVDAYIIEDSQKNLIPDVNVRSSDNPILILTKLKTE